MNNVDMNKFIEEKQKEVITGLRERSAKNSDYELVRLIDMIEKGRGDMLVLLTQAYMFGLNNGLKRVNEISTAFLDKKKKT